MKVNLKALLMQSIQLKRRLTNLLLEEPNKIYMTGLYRSMYLRIDEILDNITAIVDKPQLFADTVAASQPTRDEHFTGPDMHQGMKDLFSTIFIHSAWMFTPESTQLGLARVL